MNTASLLFDAVYACVVQVVCLEAYDSEQDAAFAHDRAVLAALGHAASAGDLNFPAHAAHLNSTQPGSATTSAAATVAAGASMASGSPWAAAAAGTPTTSVSTTTQPPQQLQQQVGGAQPDYKGVVWDPANVKYQAQALDSTGSILLLGLYSTAEQAAVEYDTRLIKSGIRDESKLNFGLARYLHLLCGSSSGAAGGLSAQGSGLGAHAAALAAADGMAAAAAAGGAEAGADTESAADAGTAGAAAAAAGGSSGTVTKGKGKKGGRGVQKGGRAKGTRRGGNPQSQYKGVSWSASTQRWAAVIWDR
jgi:hypothetical protein